MSDEETAAQILDSFSDKQRRQLLLIGFFIMEFSQTEHYLRWIMEIHVANRPGEAMRLIEYSDISRLLDGYIGVLNDAKKPAEDIRKAVNDFRKINDERVRIVHGWWSVEEDGRIELQRSSAGKEAKSYFEEPEKLMDLVERCKDLRFRACDIWARELVRRRDELMEKVKMHEKFKEMAERLRALEADKAPS